MINSKGIVQNNGGVSVFLRNLKKSTTQYKTLTKNEERTLIENYIKEDKEDELRKLLILHNIRLVFSIAKKYCKATRDFDNMFAKGLYGLTIAGNRFNLFEPVKVKVLVGYKPKTVELTPEELEKEGLSDSLTDVVHTKVIQEPIYEKRIKINSYTCKPDYIKFCTYAQSWIFKYIVDEFDKKSIKIDNNSISIDDKVKIKNSYDNNQTMENYINDMISPDYHQNETTEEKLNDSDVNSFYGKIGEYISKTNELTAFEKKIIIDTYYNHKTVKNIAQENSQNQQEIINTKKKALSKIKDFLANEMNIHSMSDFID